MDSILEILDAIKIAEEKANKIIKDSLKSSSKFPLDSKDKFSNYLFCMDNLHAIKELLSLGYSGSFDLIYSDPPFFTNLIFSKNISIDTPDKSVKFKIPVYSDNWKKKSFEYFVMIASRLILMRELLSESGTIYVHVDWRVVHYIRLIMDYIFGKERFLNEIIWAYKSGGAGRRSFSKKHDNILVYTKTKNYIFNISKEKSYNRDFKPYRFKNIEEYKDEKGWYTLVNSKDVWNIDMVGRTSSERVDYATQKPKKLLEKIIFTSSNKKSLVGDFFVGSGTSLVVADKLGRRWIGSDNSIHSFVEVKKRLKSIKSEYKTFTGNIEDNTKMLKNIEILYTDTHLEINLRNIELNKTNIYGLESESEDYAKIKYLKENAYLLLDYISIYYNTDPNINLKEFFRPNISSKIMIERLNNKSNQIYLKSIDIWGNIYINSLDILKS